MDGEIFFYLIEDAFKIARRICEMRKYSDPKWTIKFSSDTISIGHKWRLIFIKKCTRNNQYESGLLFHFLFKQILSTESKSCNRGNRSHPEYPNQTKLSYPWFHEWTFTQKSQHVNRKNQWKGSHSILTQFCLGTLVFQCISGFWIQRPNIQRNTSSGKNYCHATIA